MSMAAAQRTDLDQGFKNLRGDLRVDEPMSRHTSWRAGGNADLYFVPADRDDIAAFLQQLPPQTPVVWIGLGSNLLVRDGGVRGAVVATHKALGQLVINEDGRVVAEAGVTGAKLARKTADAGLIGAEFFAGIPGTVGGALAMNAGAFGSETWAVVRQVTVINRSGNLRRRTPDEYLIGYRTVRGAEQEWFLGADFQLQIGDSSVARERIRNLLAMRGDAQPIQLPNAGSVFRNPKDDFAARLIENAGLKGLQEGDARVSDKHANFIINQGAASAKQIEALIERVRKEVARIYGVNLETEVRVIGEPG